MMERGLKVYKVYKVHKVTGVLRIILNGNSELPLTKHLQGAKDLIDFINLMNFCPITRCPKIP